MSQLRGQNAGMRYAAFISYSHADEKSARWLMHRLESYRVPKYLIGSEGSRGAIPAGDIILRESQRILLDYLSLLARTETLRAGGVAPRLRSGRIGTTG